MTGCCVAMSTTSEHSMACSGIRWFFNASKWRPTREEWLRAVGCLQEEEVSRINRFVFKTDAKRSLVGRLLLRSAVRSSRPSLPYQDIRFGRNEKGKPFLSEELLRPSDGQLDLNVSHSGDYCVCASALTSRVGVDVMRIEYSGQQTGRPLHDFFRLMSRQFSDREWHFINGCSEEWQQLSRFIRLWALKESFVKAEGIGIAFDLKRISFECPTPALELMRVTSDTLVRVDDRPLNDWLFEESLLDDKHCVCVALRPNGRHSREDLVFRETTIDDLLRNAVPLDADRPVDPTLWSQYMQKLEKL